MLLAVSLMTASFSTDAQVSVENLLGSMTRRQKIAQIIIDAIDSHSPDSVKAAQARYCSLGLGGIIIMDDGLEDNMKMVNCLQDSASIPLLVTIDGEWGASMRYREFTQFPRAMQMGALTESGLVYQVGRAIGEELAQLKIFCNYAPVVDVNNNPKNPVINTRSFGEDRFKVAEFSSAYMRGMKDAGVAGSAKHFPGHGDTDVDSHKGLPVLLFDRERLDRVELYPFRRLIADGVDMVMVGHLSVPSLDGTGTPASVSKPIVTGLLREELGYDGIIITDALGMEGVAAGGVDAAYAAYAAGADILLMPKSVEAAIDAIDAAIEKGEASEADLDGRVRKVLELKQRCGMLSPSYDKYVNIDSLASIACRPESDSLIQHISDVSMTAVKGGRHLPLRLDGRRKVAYVAYNAISSASTQFAAELGKYGSFDRFDIPGDATLEQIDEIGEALKGYKDVIVVFHSGKPRPSTGGAKRFASVEKSQFERIASWSKKHRLYGIYLGNPYDLDNMPMHKQFRTFVIGYADSFENNRAAARAVSLGGAQGVLPVGAGGYPCGHNDLN